MVCKIAGLVFAILAVAVVVLGMSRSAGKFITRPCATCEWRISAEYVQGLLYVVMQSAGAVIQIVGLVVYAKYYRSLRTPRLERMEKLEQSADLIFGH